MICTSNTPGVPGVDYTDDGYPRLKDYVPGWRLFVGGLLNNLEDISIGILPASGLFIRYQYDSASGAQTDSPVICNLISYTVG